MTYIKQLFILSTGKHTHTHNSQLRVVFYSGTLLRTTAWEGSLSDSSGELFQKVREEPGYTGVSTEKQTNKKKMQFWTPGRTNQSILKETNPENSLEGVMLKLKLQYFGHLM